MSTNPMIPSRKETPAAKEETNVEQPKKQLKAEGTKNYAELFRKSKIYAIFLADHALCV